jgi:hypothetical protein
MNVSEYISAFKKYIGVMIVPKYPEIYDFEVVRGPKKEWNFNKKDWDPTIEITFYINGTENEFEHKFEQSLRDDMDNMKLFFDTYGKMVVHFRVVTEDGQIGRTFV